jgi:hypothetical protein
MFLLETIQFQELTQTEGIGFITVKKEKKQNRGIIKMGM